MKREVLAEAIQLQEEWAEGKYIDPSTLLVWQAARLYLAQLPEKCLSVRSTDSDFEMRCDDNTGHEGPHSYETDKGTVTWLDGETP